MRSYEKLSEKVEALIEDFEHGKLTYRTPMAGSENLRPTRSDYTMEQSHAIIKLYVKRFREILKNIACEETEARVREEYEGNANGGR